MNPFIQTLLSRIQSESPWFYKVLRKIALVLLIIFGVSWASVKWFLYPLLSTQWSDIITTGSSHVAVICLAIYGVSFTGTTTPQTTDNKPTKQD